MKIVINRCFGGFNLSHEGCIEYAKLAGIKLYPFIDKRDSNNSRTDKFEPYIGQEAYLIFYTTKPLKKDGTYVEGAWWNERDLKRDDPYLVKLVETMGDKASGSCAELKIIEIPDGVDYEIDEYDGMESVHEKHRSWS